MKALKSDNLPIYFIRNFLLFLVVAFLFYQLIAPQLDLLEKKDITRNPALVIEAFFVLFLNMCLMAIIRRKNLSLALCLLFYLIFIYSNILKIKMLDTPIFPTDIILITDLFLTWEVFIQFVPFLSFSLLLILFIFFWGIKKEQPIKALNLYPLYIFIIICLMIPIGFSKPLKKEFRANDLYFKKNANLVKNAIKYGFINHFLLASLFHQKPQEPIGYNQNAIALISSKYQLATATTHSNQKPDNVVVLLIEAFTNPMDFGWHFNDDPIKQFNQMSRLFNSGVINSPVYGGKSINAEFELLTGFSTQLLPLQSTPYREYIDRNMPSLARVFQNNGYTTNAIQVIRFHGFGYQRVYDYLGIDHKISLSAKHDETLALDPTQRRTSNQEVANKIIELTSQQNQSFIFAFPNASHAPWVIEDYPDNPYVLLTPTSDSLKNNSITAYANAINHADQMLSTLIQYFETQTEKTLIVALGDHQPGLDGYLDNFSYDSNKSLQENNRIKKYTVPVAFWSNYPLDFSDEINMNMNLLPSYITELAALGLKGFMKFNNIVRLHSTAPDFLDHSQEPSNALSNALFNDYNLLQYDIIFGKNYLKDILDKKIQHQ